MEHSQLLPQFSQASQNQSSFQSQRSFRMTPVQSSFSTSVSNKSIRLLYRGFESSNRLKKRENSTKTEEDTLELLGKAISTNKSVSIKREKVSFSLEHLNKKSKLRHSSLLKDEFTQVSPLPSSKSIPRGESPDGKLHLQELMSIQRNSRKSFEKSKYFVEPHRLGVEFNCWGGVRQQIKRKPLLRGLHYSPYLKGKASIYR
mmetsp:Transcript_29345/g.52535  ORF Transcript_29345/g.52535 Transcript_29345/m.52535 type:complete len:202 (+) Transcript_29345:2014-2619(+)